MRRISSASELLGMVPAPANIYVHGMAAAPTTLLTALAERAADLAGSRVYQLHLEGPGPHVLPQATAHLEVNAFFVGSNTRTAVNEGRAHYLPMFLSEIPAAFRRKEIPLDVTLVHCSPPDKHGYCSLGISVEATKAALENSKVVLAQINPKMPRAHGDGLIHMSSFTAYIEVEEDIHEMPNPPIDAVSAKIGKLVAGLVEDGATLQMGIGAIPNAVLAELGGHKNLGIHTEMFSDGVLPLIETGVIDNSQKRVHPGKIVSTFAMGSRALYDFLDDNPSVVLLDAEYVNDTAVIRRNPKVTAINSAIEIDLTGQVCADSIGSRIYSGVGGQMDFIRGASLSPGGKPILAMPSLTSTGDSKIVPTLRPGAGVVTTRAHVRFVATEHGLVDLHGKNLRDRAKALISIAAPEHREALTARLK